MISVLSKRTRRSESRFPISDSRGWWWSVVCSYPIVNILNIRKRIHLYPNRLSTKPPRHPKMKNGPGWENVIKSCSMSLHRHEEWDATISGGFKKWDSDVSSFMPWQHPSIQLLSGGLISRGKMSPPPSAAAWNSDAIFSQYTGIGESPLQIVHSQPSSGTNWVEMMLLTQKHGNKSRYHREFVIVVVGEGEESTTIIGGKGFLSGDPIS